jgi:hypothetical protein
MREASSNQTEAENPHEETPVCEAVLVIHRRKASASSPRCSVLLDMLPVMTQQDCTAH